MQEKQDSVCNFIKSRDSKKKKSCGMPCNANNTFYRIAGPSSFSKTAQLPNRE